jgi:hypothetical protein
MVMKKNIDNNKRGPLGGIHHQQKIDNKKRWGSPTKEDNQEDVSITN